jgi:Domain of unknown function (DUF6268)
MLFNGRSVAATDEPLHPAFADETARDPLVSPVNSTISNPLGDERLEETWDQQKLFEKFSPIQEPGRVFVESEVGSDAELVETPVKRQRAIYDSSVTSTWMAPIDGFSVSDVDAKSTLLIPVLYQGAPLRLAMGFGTTFINTPAGFDVPNPLYGLQAELRWLIALRETWAVDLGAGGGLFSDMNGSGFAGARLTGRAIFIKTINEHLKWSFGGLYVGRANLKAMPVAGLIYTPNDDVRIELLIPRSRIARRMFSAGTREHWFYAGVEVFGGNSWVIEQPGGVNNVVVYKDNRMIVGYETKAGGSQNGGTLAGRIEVGYVFSRSFQIGDDPHTLSPGGTILLRAGVSY